MVSITGFGILPFTNRPHAQASETSQAIAQTLNASHPTHIVGSAGSQPDTGVPATGRPAAPRLSADVFGALIGNQAQQLTDVASSADNASSSPAPNPDNSKAAASPAPSSAPPSLQQIAARFDIHHLTHQQESELTGQLVSSGALSQYEGVRLFATTVLADDFNSQHYRIINGQFIATTPGQPGRLIGAGGPSGGPQYDIVQRIEQALAFDPYSGDTRNATRDQNILNVLNRLDELRNGSTT